MSLLRQVIQRCLKFRSSLSVGFLRIWYIFLTVLVTAHTVSLCLAGSEPVCGVEKLCADIVKPVQPGQYEPHNCSRWPFAENSEPLLRSLSNALLKHAKSGLLTSNHVNIPVCLLAREGKVLVNPEITGRFGHSQLRETHMPRLCAVDDPPFRVRYFEEIELSFVFRGRERQMNVTGLEALQIQREVEILNGADVCGTGE